MSEDTRNIYERIEAARPNFKPVVRNEDGQVGTRHYKYADLNTVSDAVEAALLAEGVGIFPTVEMGDVVVQLRVLRATNEDAAHIIGSIPLPAELTPQQTGSAITYFRRYLLVALLNLLTESDDDGAAASSPVVTREVAPEAQAKAAPAEPVVPPGWDSLEQAQAAHKALADRIGLLPVGAVDSAAFKASHAFPYSTEDYAELEDLVSIAERILA
jgi:hypothetical protein